MLEYGNGEVFFDGNTVAFQLKYKGIIKITDKPDNLFINANKKIIIGITLDGTSLPNKLFSYEGEFIITSFKSVENNKLRPHGVFAKDIQFFENLSTNWETSTQSYEDANTKHTYGQKQRYNKHTIVVNKNIKTEYDGQYFYKDKTPVEKNTLIHIHADGIAMTGGEHNESSVQIFAANQDKKRLLEIARNYQIKTRQTSTITTARSSGSTGGGY